MLGRTVKVTVPLALVNAVPTDDHLPVSSGMTIKVTDRPATAGLTVPLILTVAGHLTLVRDPSIVIEVICTSGAATVMVTVAVSVPSRPSVIAYSNSSVPVYPATDV